MAGNFNDKTIFVETDYNNIILIDPNKLSVDRKKNPNGYEERLVDHEDLVMYANLETKIIPRTKLALGQSFDIINTTIASFAGGDENLNLNFLKPKNKTAFDSSWTDEFTGKDTRKGKGANQKIEYGITQNGKPQIRNRIDKYEDTQTLGIKSITVKITPAGTPTVDIKMTDVGGRTLFQQGDNSMYSVFFNLPYPAFYLTLKGYYGKAARFQLVLISFSAAFDASKGNFDITLKLTGKLNALLFDTTIGNMRHVTKMYPKTFTVTNQSSSQGSTTTDVTTTLGIQKLKEVYTEYNSKELIGTDLWDLVKTNPMTIEGLELKLSNYTINLNNKLKTGEFSIVNDVADYRDNINNLNQVIYSNTVSKYLDLSRVFVINEIVHIPYKSFISSSDIAIIETKINDALLGFLEGKLRYNVAFGDATTSTTLPDGTVVDNGTKVVKDKDNKNVELGGPIPIGSTNWKANKMLKTFYEKVDLIPYLNSSVDEDFWKPTYIARNGGKIPSEVELEDFKTKTAAIESIGATQIDPNTNNVISVPIPLYKFGEKVKIGSGIIADGSYLDIIKQAKTLLDKKESAAEDVLADVLSNWAATSTDGLGFTPTIRNVFGILMANAETYYRMMDDVHENAWNQRQNSDRLKVVLDNKTPNVEPYETSVGALSNTNFIYPWPLYYEKETQKDKRELYVIKYIGDTDSKDFEGGLNYATWPEVDFTEEYLARTVQKEKDILTPLNANNNANVIKFVSPNAIEFPYNTQPYTNLSVASFIYELWERSYLNSHYGNIVRDGVYNNSLDQLYGEFEGENSKIGAQGDLLLPGFLKNNVNNYNDLLVEMNKSSFSKWKYFESDIYITDYITKYLINSNELYSVDTLSNTNKTIDYANKLSENVEKFLKDTKTNDPTFLNIYPFNNLNWLKNNLANGNSVGSVRDANDTTKTFSYDQNKKIVARLTNATNGENKLFVNGYFLQSNSTPALVDATISSAIVTTRDALKNLYLNKTQKNIYATETIYDIGTSYSGALGTKIQTTSLLNTPYFVNAFIEGMSLKQSGIPNPFVGLGYLYLNSLPLITTKEKIKNINGNVTTDLDYLYATLTKFSSIHQVPYAWVLKYGSIWHRYKKYIETNIDILDNIWTDFNYKLNYDPNFSNPTKQYQYKNFSDQNVNITLQTSTNVTIPTTYVLDQINLGFYPKAMESVYYYFTNNKLFNSYSIADVQTGLTDKKVKVGINSDATFKLPLSGDPNNQNRTVNVNNIYSFIDARNNLDFPPNFNGYILLPSTGGLPINQTKFECIDDQNKLKEELLDNNGMYNGSVKLLWGVPHFGYFKNTNNTSPKKPSFDEYLKIINNNVSEQFSFNLANSDSVYSKLDEVTSIFTTEFLDVFENKFLEFCNTELPTSSLILNGEENNPPGQIKNVNEKSLQKQLLNLLSVETTVNITDEQTAGLNVANSQLSSLNGKIKDFLNFECVIKVGNPNNFDRTIFDTFSNSTDFIPEGAVKYPTYTNNLPPDITFLQTQILRNNNSDYNDAWVELYKRVGNSEISGISLSSSASTIYTFFKDNKIEFSKNIVTKLFPLIKIYATKKSENPNYTKKIFELEITKLLQDQRTLQQSMVNRTLQYLTKNLPDSKSTSKPRSAYSGNILKLNQYSAFKTFNDKWVAGSDFKGKTYFEDFLFQDRANSDIGNDLTISVDEIKNYLKNSDNKTLMDLMSTIISANQCIFFAMPSYINFYGIQNALSQGNPVPPDIPNSLFGTYLNVDYIDSRPRFLISYIGKPSENLSTNDASFVRFGDDSFDLRSTTNPVNIPSENINTNKSNRVVGFNVDFGLMNQNMFYDISLNMDEKKNTAETFKIYEQLGATAGGDTVAQQTVSLYNIYRTRSYTCNVKSLGNAMIQPTMYFNLRHIPLFYGPYWVTEVNHNISPGDFKTDFTGIRMPLYSLPTPDSFTVSINREFKENWKKTTLKERKPKDVLSTTAFTNPTLTSFANAPTDCYDKVVSKYRTIPFTSNTATTISLTDLGVKITGLTNNKIMQSLTYNFASIGLFNEITVTSNTYITCQNHNLYDISTAINHGGSLDNYIKAQVCKNFIDDNIRPIAAFSGYNEPINFMISYYTSTISLIKQLYTLNTEASILNDPAISGMATSNTVEMKQVRLGATLFQIKRYSWDTPFMFDGVGKTAQEVYDKFTVTINPNGGQTDRKSLNDPSYKAYIDIFTRGVKKFRADTEVP